MEAKNTIKTFYCELHSSKQIIRISSNKNALYPLLCEECLKEATKKGELIQLFDFESFIKEAVNHYIKLKPLPFPSKNPPSSITNVLSKEYETTNTISAKLQLLNNLSSLLCQQLQDFTSKINNIQFELYYQFRALSSNYKTAKNKVEKFYKGTNPAAKTDQRKLIEEINRLNDAIDFRYFIRLINQDMSENSSISSFNAPQAMENGRSNLERACEAIKMQSELISKIACTEKFYTDLYRELELQMKNLLNSFSIKNSFELIGDLAKPFDSDILKNQDDFKYVEELVSEKMPNPKLSLIYRGSRDSFSAKSFHNKCDHKGQTVVVVKTDKGAVFGGFTDKSWDHTRMYTSSIHAFLFCMYSKQKYAIKSDYVSFAMTYDPESGPIFGNCNGDHDIYISKDPKTDLKSYFKLFNSYGSAGMAMEKYYFNVDEIEVFAVSQ